MSRQEENRNDEGRSWPRITLWDVVVLLLLLIAGAGFLLPAVQNIRITSNQSQCSNNLRQIGLAAISANDTYKHLPPAFGTYAGKLAPVHSDKGDLPHPATIYYHLLPHLDQAGIYQRLPPLFDFPETNQYVLAPKPPLLGTAASDENAAMFKVPVYVCPSDASGDSSGVQNLSLIGKGKEKSDWGSSNYSANYLLFGMVKEPRLPESVPDGLSNTIFFTEKASICDDSATGRKGGSLWAVPAFFPSDPQASVNFGSTLGYDPAPTNPTRPYALSIFQTSPVPGACDPTLAQSPHVAGINVSMGDGSSRTISSRVSAATWSALLTPYPIRGQTRSDDPGNDWQ